MRHGLTGPKRRPPQQPLNPTRPAGARERYPGARCSAIAGRAVRVPTWPRWLGPLVMAQVLLWAPAGAMERVTVQRQGGRLVVEGRLVTEAADGGLLLLARDGALWAIQPDELVRRESTDVPFQPLDRDELAELLLKELPAGFRVRRTAHYLICHNTSPAYAHWCGSLFERLYMAFTNYWSRRGFELKKPEFPLVAIVFSDQRSYVNYAQRELGKAAASTIGCYSLRTNRMAMYDLTGRGSRLAVRSPAQINRMLSGAEAFRTVATVVHEATHQIAFNCGLHQRYSDCPLWFSEGIAIYFETPDLTSPRGWRSVGQVNHQRLARLHRYLPRRPADSLQRLITSDDRFRDTSQALDAYAEAWGLTHFLLSHHARQYVAYLERLAQKPPAVMDDPATRLREFQEAFGRDLRKLDEEFLRYVARLR